MAAWPRLYELYRDGRRPLQWTLSDVSCNVANVGAERLSIRDRRDPIMPADFVLGRWTLPREITYCRSHSPGRRGSIQTKDPFSVCCRQTSRKLQKTSR